MSRRRGFSVVPGNFDCPPAEEDGPFARRASIHRHYNPHRVEPDPSTAPMEGSEGGDLGSLRRRIGDLRAHEAPPGNGRSPGEVAAAASARARWARTSAARSARSRLHQHRLRRRTEEDAMGTVQEAVDRLNEAMDDPLPQNDWIGLVPDTEMLERRHKLRKLDGDALDQEPPPQYGYYGQVVPGRLKMSILGCDGGYLTERDDSLNRHYSPENILRNDKSVYCTERDQCNIVFQHWKRTPFALTKVVIKTPDTGFTAPVQEGLIFVSMSADDLLPRTSQYQIARPAPEGDFVSRYAELRPSMPPSTMATDWAPFSPGLAFEDISPPLGFTVTTNCNEPSDDDEDTTSPEILHDRQRRRHLGIEWPSSDDSDASTRRYRRRRASPRDIRPAPKPRTDLMVPHARFFIERKRNIVSVKFDPPVTGRYVLVKMWSPEDRDNIDVQSISIYGFAGQRFVPAIQPR